MLKKQKRTIIICAVVIALLAAAYFIFIAPMLDKTEDKEIPELLEGEVWDEGYGKIMMYPALDQNEISELTVHNEHGDFGFYQDTDGQFYLQGYKGTPYNSSYFSQLAAAARLPMALDRVTTETDNAEIYGIDINDDPAYFILKSTKSHEYKVFIGNAIPSATGYYVMMEGREAIYVLDTSIKYLLMSAENYVTPILSMPTGSDDYYEAERFTLAVDGEVFVDIKYMSESEKTATASTTYYKMLVPANYTPSSSNYPELMKTFTAFEGTSVLAFGNTEDAMTPEELVPYGLGEPKYEIYYRYKGVDNYVLVSEQLEDGTYNAYSVMFNLVANVTEEKLKFLSWDFLAFVDKPLFQKNINDIATVEIEGNDIHETFNITGTDKTLSVTPKSKGKAFGDETLVNFKKLYLKLLSLSLEDYTESKSTDEWLMTFKITTRTGKEYEYSFYAYSTRRCYFTINGEGEFYVLRDRVEQILEDTKTLMSGGEITSEMG